ncbi:MAG TPA: Shedu anti-phage system protein SduA domain-containing protein [Allosphingosinicella sp.]|jgi:hypothetical protein
MELTELISKLDEVKFARLLRHFNEAPPHGLADDQFAIPAYPVALPNTQLMIRLVGGMSSKESWLGSWAFQVAGLPSGIETSPQILEILLKELERGLRQLARLDDPLGTLLGADCDHAFRQLIGPAEGCDYHLVTNLCVGEPRALVDDFAVGAGQLLRQILVEPKWYPRFGLGTPETIAAHAPADAEQLIYDLLRSPTGYQLVAREGQVAISAFSDHGLYLAQGAGRLPATTRAIAAATATLPIPGPDKPLIDELEQLINDPAVREADIQRLFEECPALLRLINPHYTEILPHVCLSDAGGNRLIPDFMARIEGPNVWDIVELKLPKHSVSVSRAGVRKPSAQAARGIAQLLEYRDFFTKQANRDRIARRYGFAPLEPNLVLVTGMGKPGLAEWRSYLTGIPGATVVSYQFVLDQARRCSPDC